MEKSIQRVYYTKTTLPALSQRFSYQPLSVGTLPDTSLGIHHWIYKQKKKTKVFFLKKEEMYSSMIYTPKIYAFLFVLIKVQLVCL